VGLGRDVRVRGGDRCARDRLHCARGGPRGIPDPDRVGDPSPSATVSPSPSPTPTPTPSAPPLDESLIETFVAALNSGNTAVFAEGGYFSDPILVVAADSDLNDELSPVDAVKALDPLLTLDEPEPWHAVAAEDRAAYRTGPYAEFFPAGAIVVQSTTDHVIAFIGSDRTVTTLFFAASTDSLLP
jgi:hypothetical protein